MEQDTATAPGSKAENGPELVVDVVLEVRDVYTPFDWNRPNLIRWILAILASYIVYDICFSPSNQLQFLPDANSISAVIVALAVFIALGLVLFPCLRLRSVFQKAPGFKKPVKYMLNAQGLRFESADAKGEYNWSVFARVLETRKAFALAQTDYAATYIPKRCFASHEEIVRLRQIIVENFKGKCQLRRD
jgi:hypothetical protein